MVKVREVERARRRKRDYRKDIKRMKEINKKDIRKRKQRRK